MIKTLFASLCVVACCVGNDYPAKAYGECDRICKGYKAMERREEQRQIKNRLDRIERQSRWDKTY